MDPDIHFGDVEQTPTVTRLRPDHNGQLATLSVYSPQETDLQIFVELDVMRDMLAHAHSDRRVELGGVLLGAQSSDESGRPFVVISDCLRAKHFESTKGSFKFTHDTWEQITRDREQFPSELQMVGWYHTHPDWGVFLSGLDLFICDHFFNKPLDVALVIDPCQRDTGFFQWTNDADQRIRRTGGYTIFASRFRMDELRDLANELEGQAMAETGRSGNSPITVHFPPPPPTPPWQALAVLGMLGLQFCMLILLAARFFPSVDDTTTKETAALAEPLRIELQKKEADVNSKLAVLETVLQREGNLPEQVLKTLSERTAEVEELRGSLRGQQSLSKELDSKVGDLEAALADVKRSDERGRIQITQLQNRLDRMQSELKMARDKSDKAAKTDEIATTGSWWSSWLADGKSVGFGAFLGALTVGVAMLIVLKRRTLQDSAVQNVDDDRTKGG